MSDTKDIYYFKARYNDDFSKVQACEVTKDTINELLEWCDDPSVMNNAKDRKYYLNSHIGCYLVKYLSLVSDISAVVGSFCFYDGITFHSVFEKRG